MKTQNMPRVQYTKHAQKHVTLSETHVQKE